MRKERDWSRLEESPVVDPILTSILQHPQMPHPRTSTATMQCDRVRIPPPPKVDVQVSRTEAWIESAHPFRFELVHTVHVCLKKAQLAHQQAGHGSWKTNKTEAMATDRICQGFTHWGVELSSEALVDCVMEINKTMNLSLMTRLDCKIELSAQGWNRIMKIPY